MAGVRLDSKFTAHPIMYSTTSATASSPSHCKGTLYGLRRSSSDTLNLTTLTMISTPSPLPLTEVGDRLQHGRVAKGAIDQRAGMVGTWGVKIESLLSIYPTRSSRIRWHHATYHRCHYLNDNNYPGSKVNCGQIGARTDKSP